MGFYYAKEKARFDHMWVRLRKEYKAAGMNDEAIQSLYEFDCQWFKSQRTYMKHTQPLPDDQITCEDTDGMFSAMFQKFDILSSSIESNLWRNKRYDWIETISDVHIVSVLKKLSAMDLELLTLFVIDEYSQTEVAKKMACSQQTISWKLNKIRKFFK